MIPSFRRSVATRVVLLSMLAVATFAAPVLGSNHLRDATGFSGEATVVDVLVNNPLGGDPLLDLQLGEAGPLSPAGGSDEDEILNANINQAPLTATASVIRATTEGAGSTAQSVATIADLNLALTNLVAVTSTTLESTATAQCVRRGATVSGDSVIEDLAINGTTVTVTGAPNQMVDIGPIHLVINEQTENVASDRTFGEITVNALHITVTNPIGGAVLAEVILSSSHADVTCMPDGSTDGMLSATSGSTGTFSSQLPLALLVLAAVAVSLLLARRSFAHR